MLVQKYGGSSVATLERIANVANRIKARVDTGEKIIVVVSAMGETTNKLISVAKKISDDPDPRELDMLLATGEQKSAALLSMMLLKMGVKAVSYNAFQLNILTTDNHTDARIMDMNLEKVKKELQDKDVIVVTGFQGITPEGNLTTLGRGGSDTSAVAIAAKLGTRCEIYSDVAGIYTTDPKFYSKAKKLEYITYDEMLELAAQGSRVLHSRAVEIAKKYNVEVVCLSSFSDEGGTTIVNTLPEWLEQPVVTGVAMDSNQIKITINNIPNNVDLISGIFNAVAEARINIDMISIVNDNSHTHITFTAVAGNPDRVEEVIKTVLKDEKGWKITADTNVTKVSAIGVGMRSNSGVASRFFSALQREGIRIIATTTSEIKISVLVPKEESGRALKALIDEFEL